MNSLDTEFHRRMRARIEELYAENAESVCTGGLDHDRYRYACGYLRALTDISEEAKRIEASMNEGK